MKRGFFDYLELVLPKLVLAPTFIAVLVFVYGFIGWTAWISLTSSTLLPKHKVMAGYKITQKALKDLKEAEIPETIL